VAEIRDLKNRIRRLEARNSLQRASAHDGTRTRVNVGEYGDTFGLRVTDETGAEVFVVSDQGLTKAVLNDGTRDRVTLGTFTNPDTAAEDFGLIVTAADGTTVFRVGDDGLATPPTIPYVQRPSLGATHSSTSWTTAYRFRIPHCVADGLYLRSRISVGAGISSAQARLLGESGSVTSTRALTTGGSFVEYEWEWLHGQPTDGTETFVELQTRITGGAGTIDAASVSMVYYVAGDVIGATSGGF
jgi:hypothetical protein